MIGYIARVSIPEAMTPKPTAWLPFMTTMSLSRGAGGMFTSDSNLTMVNCTFSENHGAQRGGGLENHGSGIVTVTNCTITANTIGDPYLGAGIWDSGSGLTVTNSIISGNTCEDSGCTQIEGDPTVTYSNVGRTPCVSTPHQVRPSCGRGCVAVNSVSHSVAKWLSATPS